MERFKESQFLGQGMTSKVYRAFDEVTKSWVALKKINPHLCQDPISIERFKREIQITREISHSGVIKIYDVLEDNQGVSLVMEYLDGSSLSEMISSKGKLEQKLVFDVFNQLLAVLKACHKIGIVHRDIKPLNIFVLNSGSVKLIDFGIAKMTTQSDLTQTGTALGSPEYMAPELFSSQRFDARTDLYALGIVLYEMLAGVLPFQGESIAILYNQHLTQPVPAISGLKPDDFLNQFLKKLLAKNPFDRYQNIEELERDWLSGKIIDSGYRSIERSACTECGAAKLSSLPVCTRCGHEQFTGGGEFTLCAKSDSNPKKLAEFLHKYFSVKTVLVKNKTGYKILSGLSAEYAKSIQLAALEEGLFLQIFKEDFRSTIKDHSVFVTAGIGAWLLFSFWILVAIQSQLSYLLRAWKEIQYGSDLYAHVILEIKQMFPFLGISLAILYLSLRPFFALIWRKSKNQKQSGRSFLQAISKTNLFLSICTGLGVLYLAFSGRPTADKTQDGLIFYIVISSAIAYLLFTIYRRLSWILSSGMINSEYAKQKISQHEQLWVLELVPYLKNIKNLTNRDLLSNLIEKLVSMVAKVKSLKAEREKLSQFLKSIAEVLTLLDEIERQMTDLQTILDRTPNDQQVRKVFLSLEQKKEHMDRFLLNQYSQFNAMTIGEIDSTQIQIQTHTLLSQTEKEIETFLLVKETMNELLTSKRIAA